VRLKLLGASATVAVSMLSAPASAAPHTPVGTCPLAFEGPYTTAEIIEAFPPPQGFPNPEEALLAYDLNGDQLLCVRALPTEPTGGNINIIDNIVRPR
jgi:hypothetical protein